MDRKDVANIIETEMPGYELADRDNSELIGDCAEMAIAPPARRWRGTGEAASGTDEHIENLRERFFGPALVGFRSSHGAVPLSAGGAGTVVLVRPKNGGIPKAVVIEDGKIILEQG